MNISKTLNVEVKGLNYDECDLFCDYINVRCKLFNIKLKIKTQLNGDKDFLRCKQCIDIFGGVE